MQIPKNVTKQSEPAVCAWPLLNWGGGLRDRDDVGAPSPQWYEETDGDL